MLVNLNLSDFFIVKWGLRIIWVDTKSHVPFLGHDAGGYLMLLWLITAYLNPEVSLIKLVLSSYNRNGIPVIICDYFGGNILRL